MRTTLNIADDVLVELKQLAREENRSLGSVVTTLLRAALRSVSAQEDAEPPAVLGFRPFPRRGVIVTKELGDELREDGPH